jgi:DNA-binding transcriptional LysR family regulator
MGLSDLRSLDVSHLMMLRQLLTDRSVTRTAEKLGVPQPSVSRVLKRLRAAFADPLLVRSGADFVLTERGAAVKEAIADILQRLDGIAAAKTAFVPSEATRVFSIACADCVAVALVPRIIAGVTASGPGLRVKFRSIDPAFSVPEALKSGDIDLVIDNSPSPPESLRLAPLYNDDVVLMMRRGHPAAAWGRPDLEAYLSLKHLAPHPSSLREGGTDRRRARTRRLPTDRLRNGAGIQSRPLRAPRDRSRLHHWTPFRRASRPACADRRDPRADLLSGDAIPSAMA